MESNYRTLTNDEKDNFINSLNNNNFRFKYSKYDRSQYKGIYYNTFIIHYENGDKINFDKVHIEKIDNEGNSLYFKIINPFECEIDYILDENNEEINEYYKKSENTLDIFPIIF